ncbi:MAG: type II toxin-antitoxin system VapB family antitoxin [Bryobacteraceae bacterium]
MPLYINDAEVSRLADELAAKRGESKTELVRKLLREENARLGRLQTAEERLRRLKEISAKAAKIARESDPPFSYTKKNADAMFEYLESEAKAATRRKRRAS